MNVYPRAALSDSLALGYYVIILSGLRWDYWTSSTSGGM
jgi:hypothetical protein